MTSIFITVKRNQQRLEKYLEIYLLKRTPRVSRLQYLYPFMYFGLRNTFFSVENSLISWFWGVIEPLARSKKKSNCIYLSISVFYGEFVVYFCILFWICLPRWKGRYLGLACRRRCFARKEVCQKKLFGLGSSRKTCKHNHGSKKNNTPNFFICIWRGVIQNNNLSTVKSLREAKKWETNIFSKNQNRNTNIHDKLTTCKHKTWSWVPPLSENISL